MKTQLLSSNTIPSLHFHFRRSFLTCIMVKKSVRKKVAGKQAADKQAATEKPAAEEEDAAAEEVDEEAEHDEVRVQILMWLFARRRRPPQAPFVVAMPRVCRVVPCRGTLVVCTRAYISLSLSCRPPLVQALKALPSHQKRKVTKRAKFLESEFSSFFFSPLPCIN
jgi:hypothetical protein